MKEFMVVIRGSFQTWNKNSPEQMQQIIQKYIDWSNELVAQDRMRGGHGLSDKSVKIEKVGNELITTDGPYAESKEALTGYFIIAAKDMEDIQNVVKTGCPAFSHGEFVEIIELGE